MRMRDVMQVPACADYLPYLPEQVEGDLVQPRVRAQMQLPSQQGEHRFKVLDAHAQRYTHSHCGCDHLCLDRKQFYVVPRQKSNYAASQLHRHCCSLTLAIWMVRQPFVHGTVDSGAVKCDLKPEQAHSNCWHVRGSWCARVERRCATWQTSSCSCHIRRASGDPSGPSSRIELHSAHTQPSPEP